MPHQRLPAGVPAPLKGGVANLLSSLHIATQFPADVLEDARRHAANPPHPALDLTDLPFVTLDPAGSLDLDQALHIEALPAGYRVRYAIADVAGFVPAGSPVDAEARRRGATVYAPGTRYPLHPEILSEHAASLLADGVPRPACVWTIDLDKDGAVQSGRVERALVRNRAQLNYRDSQDSLDAGQAEDELRLLEEVGRLREQQESERGGISLNLPEQEVEAGPDGWRLRFRSIDPIEGWNAQISLLTGNVAATIMIGAGVGILRTLPPAEPDNVDRLRRIAQGLQIPWPAALSYADFVRSLDPAQPTHLAMMTSCTTLFRGAGYLAFTNGAPAGDIRHAALAMPYAHVTAPLRRLVDRFGTEVCLAVSAGTPVPDWVTAALGSLPAIMANTDATGKEFERGVIDLLEALVLSDRLGQTFEGIVTSVSKGRGHVQLADPAVEITVTGEDLPLGGTVRLRVVSADVATGRVVAEAV